MSQVLVRHRLGQGEGEVIACSCGAVGLLADGETHVCDPNDTYMYVTLQPTAPVLDAVVRVDVNS